MDAREFMMSYRTACNEVDRLNERLIRANQSLLFKSTSYEGVGGGSGGSSERTAILTSTIEELKHKLTEAEIEKALSLRQINAIIVQLDPDEYNVMLERYIRCVSFDKIATNYGKSFSWCHKVHAKAIESVQELLNQ